MTFEESIRAIVREEVRAALREAQAPAPTGGMLTIEEAAAHAKCSKATLHKWLRDGALTRHGSGKLTRVDRAQLDQVLANGVRQSKPARDPAAIALALVRG